MFIVSTAQMQLAEAAADARGQSYAQLMENAGSVLVEAMAEQFNLLGAQVTILIGPGNNGGDGLVAAQGVALEQQRAVTRVAQLVERPEPRYAAADNRDVCIEYLRRHIRPG